MLRYIRRKLFFIILLAGGVTGAAIYFSDKAVNSASNGKTFTNAEEIPYNRTGLLLGTGKFLKNGSLNPYYTHRIDAALELFRAGKMKYLVISGDNSRRDYSEPEMMRTDLIQVGIDSTKIFLDYAGFRTFDSMVRLREIFGQDSVTVISQRFHNERAIYIASREEIHAIGYNAKDVGGKAGLRVQAREKLARVNLFLDYFIGKEPKFLGERVEVR